MQSGVTRRVLLLLPQPLLDLTDAAASKLYMSRLAFIRLSLIRNLGIISTLSPGLEIK